MNYSAPLRLVTPPSAGANSQVRTLSHLAKDLRTEHALLKSWRKAASACQVLTVEGKPDPGLAQRIALHGYEPRRVETRTRIGLEPVCTSCGQHIRQGRPRNDNALVEDKIHGTGFGKLGDLVQLFKALEVGAKPNQIRTYSRSGRRVI
jgi:hypothetical protein